MVEGKAREADSSQPRSRGLLFYFEPLLFWRFSLHSYGLGLAMLDQGFVQALNARKTDRGSVQASMSTWRAVLCFTGTVAKL